jgi:hypothetical protein
MTATITRQRIFLATSNVISRKQISVIHQIATKCYRFYYVVLLSFIVEVRILPVVTLLFTVGSNLSLNKLIKTFYHEQTHRWKRI